MVYNPPTDSAILHQSISISHIITNIIVNPYHLNDVILVVLDDMAGFYTILPNITNITHYCINQFRYFIIISIFQ